MTKNPFLNALAAAVYVSLVASFLYYGPAAVGQVRGVIVPMALLSVFVLSAAVMGLIFFYNPTRVYLDGDKAGAVSLMVKTVLAFALITIAFVVVLLLVPFF